MRCYICSRTLIKEGNNVNVSHPKATLCLNCEQTMMKKIKKDQKHDK